MLSFEIFRENLVKSLIIIIENRESQISILIDKLKITYNLDLNRHLWLWLC